jgi:hypothetical protein
MSRSRGRLERQRDFGGAGHQHQQCVLSLTQSRKLGFLPPPPGARCLNSRVSISQPLTDEFLLLVVDRTRNRARGAGIGAIARNWEGLNARGACPPTPDRERFHSNPRRSANTRIIIRRRGHIPCRPGTLWPQIQKLHSAGWAMWPHFSHPPRTASATHPIFDIAFSKWRRVSPVQRTSAV